MIMKKISKRTLGLNRETIRALSDRAATDVHAGAETRQTSQASFVYSCIFFSCNVLCIHPL
jgi:hypothetical protein